MPLPCPLCEIQHNKTAKTANTNKRLFVCPVDFVPLETLCISVPN